MTKSLQPTNPKVDAYLNRARTWQEEMRKLRAMILPYPLTEELKWGKPCYVFEESNILIIQAFKEYLALMFCKGALLSDPHALLHKPGESTQAARQLRFPNLRALVAQEPVVKAYIAEAIAAARAGLKVEFKQAPEPVPAELQSELEKSPAFKTAFTALTPGRQRGYILYLLAAKQSKTRAARVEKCRPLILKGKGLND